MRLQMVQPIIDPRFIENMIFCCRCGVGDVYQNSCNMGWFNHQNGICFHAYLCPFCAQAALNKSLQVLH